MIAMKRIFIYGPPGSGKTTVGKILAEKIGGHFLDIDEEIEKQANLPVSRIIADQGETVFRDMESQVISQICCSNIENSDKLVIALGGGSLLRDGNRANCENSGLIVFLEANLSLLLANLKEEHGQRPLLSGDVENRLEQLLADRKSHYDSFKLRVVNILSGNFNVRKTPEEISWEIQKKIGLFTVHGMGGHYDVFVEPGALESLGKILTSQGINGPIAVVCDENVQKYYGQQVLETLGASGFRTNLIVLPPGEEYKTLRTVEHLWNNFLISGLDRKSTVLALGGGVVSDMVGFAASTFMRGCNWVAVPTTLLSMVDASLGGKTGFDLPEGKNLIGSFYPPRFVLTDPEVLSSLPDIEFRSGLAEVVKHGIIADPELFDLCASGYTSIKKDIADIVRKAVGVKVRIIESDPFESGIRASLNLGHTVGHAIETVSNYQLRHGEAVSIGMVIETKLAEKLGIVDDSIALSTIIQKVLSLLGLPTELPENLDVTAIREAMKVDKKKVRNVVNFALPENIGCVRVGVSVKDLEIVL